MYTSVLIVPDSEKNDLIIIIIVTKIISLFIEGYIKILYQHVYEQIMYLVIWPSYGHTQKAGKSHHTYITHSSTCITHAHAHLYNAHINIKTETSIREHS